MPDTSAEGLKVLNCEIFRGDSNSFYIPSMQSSFSITISEKPTYLLNPSLYAPAIPGIAVAIIGLFVAHYLSRVRDRRKEVRDICDKLKDQAEKCVDVSALAWSELDGTKRASLVAETKRRLQILGTTASHIRQSTRTGCFNPMRFWSSELDIRHLIVRLRQACTKDPFDDPSRLPAAVPWDALEKALSDLELGTDDAFRRRYP
ncbi:hypothetical protein ACO2RV_14530 [Ancylobacter sp. VNQ12]|uniref:hypothetical protein n=1 Tax=Ancylobacter sp. VNQ12 TaxID=3400920 RepID=UPI003C11AE24